MPPVPEDEKDEAPVKALDEDDIALLKTYGLGPYAQRIKDAESGACAALWCPAAGSCAYATSVAGLTLTKVNKPRTLPIMSTMPSFIN